MSAAHDLAHEHHGPLHHQFEDLEQQDETYIIGMWTFLVTEVMFFGALFLTYCLFRWRYSLDFLAIHHELDWKLGAFNTLVLLFSSYTMVLAVHNAQKRERLKVMMWLAVTIGCAATFLVVKYFEYSAKFEHHLFPGPKFGTIPEHLNGANPNAAQLFFDMYFTMTGLHALHIIIGILLIGTLAAMWFRKNRLVTEDYVPTEMVGLYWHFVDLVWIFLFPLFYLIPN